MALDLSQFRVGGPAAPAFDPGAFRVAPEPVDNLVSDSGRWLVEDGDTIIDQQTGEVFRLYGMDTPETPHPEKGWNRAELGAGAATRRTLDYVNRMEAQGGLQLERGDKDAYGRTLARVPGHAAEMVRSGAAVPESRVADPEVEGARLERMVQTASAPPQYDTPPEEAAAATDRIRRAVTADDLQRPNTYTTGGTLERAVTRGVDTTAGLMGSAAEAAGQLTGWEGLEQAGRGYADAKMRDVQANPAEVPTWEDVHSLGDFGTYALERVGEQAANLALMATGGGIGAMVGKRALGSALAGRMTGAAAGTYTQAVGDIQNEFNEGGIRAPGKAFLWGIPYAGAEALSFETMLGRFFGEGNKVVAKNLIRAISKEAGKAIGMSSATEAGTEYAQELMVLTARAMEDPSFEIFSEENLRRLKNAAIAGGTVGGILGGAGGAMHGALNYEQIETATDNQPTDVLHTRMPRPTPGVSTTLQKPFDPADVVLSGEAQGTTKRDMPANESVPYSYGAGMRGAELSALGAQDGVTGTAVPEPGAWYDALPDDLEIEVDAIEAETGEQYRAKVPAKQTVVELEQAREAYAALRACMAR